LNKQIIEQAKK